MKIHYLLSGLLLGLTACGVLQPVKDLAVHHVLEPLVPDRDLTTATPAIAVNRPSLPSYLDRLQMVTRAGGELVLSDHDLWAESLGTAISRVTASNLSRLTRSMNIQPVENFVTLDYTTLLELKIARFDPDTSNQMILQGTWKLQPVTGKETRTRYFHIIVPVPATPDTMTGRVTAMNQALELLARQIARQW
jgi:uncharacterized lipoprotein YmbA